MAETELADLLRAGAKGLYRDEAAVGLLIDHGSWLSRPLFVETLVEDNDDTDVPVMAWVDWSNVDNFLEHAPCSGSEESILRIAAGLAGQPVKLGLELPRLDTVNIGLVLKAVAHCNGLHERSDSPPLGLGHG